MRFRILRHPDLEKDLFDIVDWITDYAGVAAAERVLSEIQDAILKLAETPLIGSVRDEIHPGLRAIPVARKGVLTFVVDEKQQTVLIVSVTYAGADWVTRAPSRTAE